MIDPASQAQLKEAIADCIGTDQGVLDALREEIRLLRAATRRIQPRATTSISLVGTDGGNNQLQFDPFLIQLVRVVDSSNNEYCLEAVSPTTPVQKLNERQFAADGSARTALGEMMAFLGVDSLPALSHMIRPTDKGKPASPSWVGTSDQDRFGSTDVGRIASDPDGATVGAECGLQQALRVAAEA